jgi:hypothetical protein
MQDRFRWAAVVMGLGLALSMAVADDQKPAAKDKTPAKDNLVPVGQIEGKLVRVETDKKVLAVEVNNKIPQAVPQGRRVEVRYHDQKKTLEYPIADNVQVLRKDLPVELDDKGKPKKPTAADLKKRVKGPGGLMGYPAELDNVKKDQIVIVFLKQKKDALKAASKAKKDEKEFLDDKPLVTTIYIEKDA